MKNVTKNTHTDEDDESSDECAFGIQAKVTKIHNKLPYYDITINGKKTKILIDTGSSINIIDEDTLGKINLKPKLDEPKTKAYAYGQSAKLPIKGTFKATTESKHRITVSEFHVVKRTSRILIRIYNSSRTTNHTENQHGENEPNRRNFGQI